MKSISSRKWFYPLTFGLMILLCVWPPYTQYPYDPRETRLVIMDILMNASQPYAHLGWVFHVATLGLILFTVYRPDTGGRLVTAYFGLNYMVVAAIQTHAITKTYGLAVQSGALISNTILGVLWLWQAWRNNITFTPSTVPAWRWLLSPLVLLVFWLPVTQNNGRFVFDFDPILLLTSPDYGLAYCFMTPVFLYFLILAFPGVNRAAFRVTAFNALLYGLLNLIHWFDPGQRVLGVMHLPLLIMALVSLVISQKDSRK